METAYLLSGTEEKARPKAEGGASTENIHCNPILPLPSFEVRTIQK